jgi:GNAT superfamily N-acetyltransferase
MQQKTLPPAVLKALAADLACDEQDFFRDGNTVVPYRVLPGRRRFPVSECTFHLLTVGHGAVITADEAHYAWARDTLARLPVSELLTGNGLARMMLRLQPEGRAVNGPMLAYVCREVTPQALRAPLRMQYLEGTAIAELYSREWLQMALSYYTEGDRPDVVATAAWDGDTLAGVAGCSADNDDLWQVGIDVAPEYRGQGVGAALVAGLTQRILDRGKVPYYTTALHNLASQRVAYACGYHPGWVAVYAR